MRDRVLITGPAGRLGPHILPLLRPEFALRLLDVKPLVGEGDDEIVQADIRDFAAVKAACAGAKAVVHLAAIPDEDDFYTRLLPINIEGAYTVFEAARQAGVPKLVYASTCQTILNYGPGVWVTPEMPARPSSVYACTKMFGEALARHYADCHGMSALCLRISWFQGYDSPLLRERPDMWREWCSPGDLAQLIAKAIRADLKFGVFFGVSNNTGRFWDISNGRELLGYEPKDNAFERGPTLRAG